MSKAIRRLRLGVPLSQEELARNTGISKSTVIRLENGKARPRGLVAAKLARFFNIDLEALERGDYDE